jgi:hypothetical protein
MASLVLLGKIDRPIISIEIENYTKANYLSLRAYTSLSINRYWKVLYTGAAYAF